MCGIRKSFGNVEVLRGIDLQINVGERVVLFGPSGSGKSTVLQTITMLEPTNAGSLVVDGMVFQHSPGRCRKATPG